MFDTRGSANVCCFDLELVINCHFAAPKNKYLNSSIRVIVLFIHRIQLLSRQMSWDHWHLRLAQKQVPLL